MPDIQATNLTAQALGRECKPPKVISVPLDFTSNAQFRLDTKPSFDIGAIDAIICCYVDNRANANRLDILVSGTLQTVSVPAGRQGYFHLLAPNAATFTFTSVIAAINVNVFLLNYDVPGANWS